LPPYGDWIVCAISTQLRQEVKGFDFIIDETNPDFMLSGLKRIFLPKIQQKPFVTTAITDIHTFF